MNKNVFLTLEFDKIIDHLSHLPISTLGLNLIQQIKPLSDPVFIEQKLKQATELREILDFDDPFPLAGLQDITGELDKLKIEGNFLPAENLVAVAQTLEAGRKIKFYFEDRQEKYPNLAKIVSRISVFKAIEKEISRCVDRSNFLIFDNASPELNRIRRLIVTQEEQIRRKLDNMLANFSSKGYLQESLVAMRSNRLVLMVKDEHKSKVKGLVHDQSATGATLFVEPIETLELNNKIRALKIEEKREVERILSMLSNMLRAELPAIVQSVSALAMIDFIYAKAKFSREIGGSQPAINADNDLEIIKGKHPLLVLRYGSSREVVPVDVTIGKDFNTLVISGPNAGGKTVALKTIGLLSLMVVCGLHIPADPSSNIAIFENIFASIGDQQSLENDLSTFSSHVAALKNITDSVNKKSLVLIDEIGAGTDPDEGAALAIAILEKLTAIACLTVVSTHQGALKVFAHDTDGVENGSMEFNRETLQPTYRFRVGIPGSSYAYEIADRLGISEQLTNRARELVGSEKNQIEKLLTDLEDRLQRHQNLTNELVVKNSSLDALIKLYENKTSEIREKEGSIKQQAIVEAEQILADANTSIELAIKQIKEEQASREAIKEVKNLIQHQKEKLVEEKIKLTKIKKADKAERKPLTKVKLGQEIYWQPFKSRGIVMSAPDASGRVLIQVGDVKIKAPLSELYRAPLDSSTTAKTGKISINANIKTINKNEIDIRGYRVEEGIDAVDKFLDEAFIAGLEQIYIIHGKGTGSLRKGIYKFLDKHPRVKSKSFPDWSLGDTGMTIVTLK